MASIKPQLGHGSGITMSTSTGFLANIHSINWDGMTREVIETTHMGTTVAKTFLPDPLYDPGELTVEMDFDSDAGISGLSIVTAAGETVTITWPDGETWACAGWLTDLSITAERAGVISATAKIKFTGTITP